MVLWGGLQPIVSRLLIDVLTLSGLFYSIWTEITSSKLNAAILVSACLLTVATAGPTNRWTLTFPMIPIVILQCLRRIPKTPTFLRGVYFALSLIFLLKAGVLTVLFPAVELQPTDGPYNVGVIDFYLSSSDDLSSGHFLVRLLYPTNDEPDLIPYLSPDTAEDYCRSSMQFGAPPPLQNLDWMLHTWRLTQIQAKRNATVADGRFPAVVYSHGLGGSSEIYSYQTMNLASHGHVVASLTHTEGSAAVVKRKDGSLMQFDFDIGKIWQAGKVVDYVRKRREMTRYRSSEIISTAEFMKLMNNEAIDLVGRSFVGKLDTERIFFMGHSFGGASAIHAADRRPDLSTSVIAHDPALDWLPDESRYSLFHPEIIADLADEYDTEGTGGYDAESVDRGSKSHSIHDFDLLLLSSHEWHEKGWAFIPLLLEMQSKGLLGTQGQTCHHEVIEHSHHNEFSDTCMLTPIWLARSVGLTGPRNPHDTAKEINEKTRSFIETVVKKRKEKSL